MEKYDKLYEEVELYSRWSIDEVQERLDKCFDDKGNLRDNVSLEELALIETFLSYISDIRDRDIKKELETRLNKVKEVVSTDKQVLVARKDNRDIKEWVKLPTTKQYLYKFVSYILNVSDTNQCFIYETYNLGFKIEKNANLDNVNSLLVIFNKLNNKDYQEVLTYIKEHNIKRVLEIANVALQVPLKESNVNLNMYTEEYIDNFEIENENPDYIIDIDDLEHDELEI